jgi:molybdopterin-guanine dinucleotide biosynthesis protein A
VGSKTIIERIIDRLSPIASEIMAVVPGPDHGLPPLPGLRIVPDVLPGKGPLAGIYAGLLASSNPINIAVACDMPFLSTALLRHMVASIDGADALIPRTADGNIEPLHAVYAKTCLPAIKQQLDREHYNIRSFLGDVKVRYMEEAECRRYDPDLLSLFNINRPSDLELALRTAGSEN